MATLLAAIKSGGDIEAVYCRVVEEHEDNLRFLDDFTRVTGIPVKTITDEAHQGSIYNVFGRRGYINVATVSDAPVQSPPGRGTARPPAARP